MKINYLDEDKIRKIGHAFGYYDYKNEQGMNLYYSGKDAVARYICGYARMALRAGWLYATPGHEAFIAYKLPGQKISFGAAMCLMKGFIKSMSMKELLHMMKMMGSSEQKSLNDIWTKEKKDFIYVGMVVVLEEYQGQGYMRKVLQMAFDEGKRLGVPVVLDTDAKSKCDKYIHLGMELYGTRKLKDGCVLYDLVKYPDIV